MYYRYCTHTETRQVKTSIQGNSHASKAAAPATTSASWRSSKVGKPGWSDGVLAPLTSDNP